MGTYRSTFIGPYLIVKDSITTNEIVEYFHPESGKKMKTKFDPNTGVEGVEKTRTESKTCLLYTSPSPRDGLLSRMPSSA